MSIATRRAKFRLATAAVTAFGAAAVVAPAAHATLTVSLQFANGTTSMNLSASNNGAAIPVYVYATVTGASAPTVTTTGSMTTPTSGNFDGLQYLYYNILNSTTGTAVAGGLTAATLNSTLMFDGTGTQPTPSSTTGAFGAQTGTINGSTGVALGSSAGTAASLTAIAKPRSNAPVYSTAATYNGTTYTSLVDGTNVKVSGNSVSFLVETLSFTPSAFTSGTTTTFTPSIPTAAATTPYAPANWFEDNTSRASGGIPANTSNGVVSGTYNVGTGVVFIDTATTRRPGDITGDGNVDFNDLVIFAQNYGKMPTTFDTGDFNGDGKTDFNDLVIFAQQYNKPASGLPAAELAELDSIAGPTFVTAFQTAVPEPTTLGLIGMGAVALSARRRKA